VLFSEFFHDLDVVPSDIAAGLTLLRAKERTHMELQQVLVGELNDKPAVSLDDLTDVAYFSKFALGVC